MSTGKRERNAPANPAPGAAGLPPEATSDGAAPGGAPFLEALFGEVGTRAGSTDDGAGAPGTPSTGTAAAGAARRPTMPPGTGPRAPWTFLPRTWLEPAAGPSSPWRTEEGLSPRPLTPYSAALWQETLPPLTARISRDLSLPSDGVDLAVDEHGRLLGRPHPVGRAPGVLTWRAARHGWTAGRQAATLVRWWDEAGPRTLLADAGELRLRVIPLERQDPSDPATAREWRRVLERCREIWLTHLDRMLRLEALATLSFWQLEALLDAFRLPGSPRAADLVPVPGAVAEIPQRLWHLAARGREDPAVTAVFTEPPYHPRLSRLAAGVRPGLDRSVAASPTQAAHPAPFFALWHQFLERYGYVAWPAAELAAPTWAEDPEPVLALLARFFHDRRLSPIADEINARRRQQALEATIARHLARRPVDRGRIAETRRLAEVTVRVAAEMGYHMLVLRSWWRRAVLGAGRALAARGLLEEPAAVWRLTPHELEAALAAAGTRGAPGRGPGGGPDDPPSAAFGADGIEHGPTHGANADSPAGGVDAAGGTRQGSTGAGGRSPADGPGGRRGAEGDEPDDALREQARRRANAIFRYAGIAYFALLALIPVIMARQGVLWIGLVEMARLLVEVVLIFAPVAAVAAAVLLGRRRRSGRGDRNAKA